MPNSKYNFISHFFLIVVSITSLLSTRILYAKQNPEIAALAIQQTCWAKASFQKAEKKIAKIHIGMAEGEFLSTMGMRLFNDSHGRTITLTMDGFILKLGENIKTTKMGRTQTYVFGYVDGQNILREKYFIIAKDDKIIEKIQLDKYEWKIDEPLSLDIKSNSTKDSYLRAVEYVKSIRPGMWSGEVRHIMHMVGIWSGQNVNRGEVITSAEGEFFFFGPGYLRDRFHQEESEEGLTQQFVFGYEENGNIIPGFIVCLKNLQVTKVEYL